MVTLLYTFFNTTKWLSHLLQQLAEPIHDHNKLTATVEPFLPAPDHKMMGMVVQRQISNWSTPTVIYTLINSICVPGIWENYICIGVDASYVLDYLQDNLYTIMWYQDCQRMPSEDYQQLICKWKTAENKHANIITKWTWSRLTEEGHFVKALNVFSLEKLKGDISQLVRRVSPQHNLWS